MRRTLLALFVTAAQQGDLYHFVSFKGNAVTVDLSGEVAQAGKPWSLVGPVDAKAGWRPGGYQPVALHRDSGMLYVGMHPKGYEGSHKNPAHEVWAYDLKAQRLVARSAERMPESEYPPQTLGYLAEVEETVHGQQGGLERALDLYRRAWLLNRSQEHLQNRANLDLNIGNAAFLLGRNATAWNHYSRRLAAGVPFDNPDTELIFQQRYAGVAFQMGEKEAPIAGYGRALQLAQGRLDPARPLDLFGRLSRRVLEWYFDNKQRGPAVEQALVKR